MTLGELAYALNKPNFVNKLHTFAANADHFSDLDAPKIDKLTTLYPSALATYSTPSDLSGISGMQACTQNVFMQHLIGGKRALAVTLSLLTPTPVRMVCAAWM